MEMDPWPSCQGLILWRLFRPLLYIDLILKRCQEQLTISEARRSWETARQFVLLGVTQSCFAHALTSTTKPWRCATASAIDRKLQHTTNSKNALPNMQSNVGG